MPVITAKTFIKDGNRFLMSPFWWGAGDTDKDLVEFSARMLVTCGELELGEDMELCTDDVGIIDMVTVPCQIESEMFEGGASAVLVLSGPYFEECILNNGINEDIIPEI